MVGDAVGVQTGSGTGNPGTGVVVTIGGGVCVSAKIAGVEEGDIAIANDGAGDSSISSDELEQAAIESASTTTTKLRILAMPGRVAVSRHARTITTEPRFADLVRVYPCNWRRAQNPRSQIRAASVLRSSHRSRW